SLSQNFSENWHGWTGRYAWLPVIYWITASSPGSNIWFAPLLLCAWVGSFYLFYQVWLRRGHAALMAMVSVAAILAIAPSAEQSVYWVSAATNTTLPLVILPFLFWLLFRKNRHGWLALVLLALAAFINAGFNE